MVLLMSIIMITTADVPEGPCYVPDAVGSTPMDCLL